MLPVRVSFVAAECEPWAKTGGLGDVVDALARALGRIPDGPTGQVDVYLPRYRSVPVPEGRIIGRSEVAIVEPGDGSRRSISIVDVAADGYRLRLVDDPPAFDRPSFYGEDGDYADNAWRFTAFGQAAVAAMAADGGTDVIHLHDWHAAPAGLVRDALYADDPRVAGAAIVLTCHNLAFHGWVPPDHVADLGPLPPDVTRTPDGGLDLLADAVARADMVNTVSPTFAREALTPEFGMGLEEALRLRGDRFIGILNGIDTELWDPATDAVLAARYSATDLRGKAAARSDLLERIGFDPGDRGVVVGKIGRLDPQKGFDLTAAAAARLSDAGVRLVIQGSGDPAIAGLIRRLAEDRPERVALVGRFDRAMARRIYAGADLFLMPSRFEPSGQGQMIALRYGTPPVVRRTGGLADTVVDVSQAPHDGTGFTFDDATPEALADAVERAAAFRRNAPAWDALVRRGMALDFSWESGPAPRYLEMYRRAIGLRRGL
jgi:starch synthase